MKSLFGESLEPSAAKRAAPTAPAAEGPFAAVALEQAIDRLLDYQIPKPLQDSIQPSQRVRVPLGRGNKRAFGYVIAIHPTSEHPSGKIKPISDIDDPRVLLPPALMELARWMSRYYVAPLGVVLESVVPSAVRKKVGLGYNQIVRLAKSREETQTILETLKTPKRRAILARMLQLDPGEGIELVRLAGEAGVKTPTVRKLSRIGLLTISQEVDLPRLAGAASIIAPSTANGMPLELNPEQQRAFDDVAARLNAGFSVNLLHGVTGSGKTEVYLQLIRRVIDRGRQAIVLVPEIALTPQTVRRFTERFPRVAVLHSGLSATQRHRYWQQISTGLADVVIGARSAIFAPLPNTGIIVVDEEHESSYKQDTAPRYHARDVAIKRGQIEKIPVLLGSATPSLEMYHKVSDQATERRSDEGGEKSDEATSRGSDPELPPSVAPSLRRSVASSYHLLQLPHRVRGLALPHIEIVDMKTASQFRKGVHLLSQRLEHLLGATIQAGQQAILLLNRRGYSNFVYCPSCMEVIQCRFCDKTMTYHRSAGANVKTAASAEGVHTGQLHCHYCLAVNPLPPKCPQCGKRLSLFGLGTQRVEEELTKKFPELRFARVDSDSMHSAKDYEALLARFGAGEIQVMLGTQMIAKGLDYPNVTLVGVISGDTALSLPDFRASERTFQLITQVAGRAGRGDAPGRVVLQTFQPDDPTIRAALKQDFVGFARNELASRREVGLPPFSRMARLIIREHEEPKLHALSEKLAAHLADAIAADGNRVKMKGPMPCAISRIAGYFRNQIILNSRSAAALQSVLAMARAKGNLAKSDRIAVDVDPVSLL